jgi:hypothetical protein
MVFADWTFSGTGSGDLDASVKYSGNSSYKASPAYGAQNALTHDTFLEPQATIILWTRTEYKSSTHVRLSTYGTIDCSPTSYDTWEKQRVTFWYDANSNIIWGRHERWVASAWVFVADTNFGTGSPSAGDLVLIGSTPTGYTKSSWFDEVDVYS